MNGITWEAIARGTRLQIGLRVSKSITLYNIFVCVCILHQNLFFVWIPSCDLEIKLHIWGSE